MKSKKIIFLIVIILVVLLFGNSVQASDRQKGDINGDNKISITDISQLKLHLVGMKEIATEYQAYADINGDGKVSITDLSKLKTQLVGLANVGEELSINSELVKELYGYIPNASDIRRWDEITDTIVYPLDAYRSKKVIIADIDNQVILKEAFYNKEIEVGINAFVTDGPEELLRESHVGETAWYKFKEEVLEEAVSKMYGPNVNLKHEDFQVAQVASCTYISEEKMYHYSWGGGVDDYWSNITKITNAVKENNEIHIYVKNAYMHTKGLIFKIYDSSERNTVLKEVVMNDSEFDYSSESARYEIVKDYMKNYKHTFKQAKDGSYYWYSTEPIE